MFYEIIIIFNENHIIAEKFNMTSVYLRKRKGTKGRLNLYLDYYPALFNPLTRKTKRHESLKMFIYEHPKNMVEQNYNEETLKLAEAIRCKRSISIMSKDLGFFEESFGKCDFLEFFEKLALTKHHSWMMALKSFSTFMNGKCRFENLSVKLAEDYKEWLLTKAMCGGVASKKKLSQNTASKYFVIFRAVLKKAYNGKCIRENISDYLDTIPTKKSRREYLTVDEVKRLCKAECMHEVLKRASLFSILTGLRFSDIKSLDWSEICVAPDGKPCIRKRIQKTDMEETIFISEQALSFCGERKESGPVFEGFSSSMVNYPLKKWLEEAHIHKHISFHCFRHTNATLMVANGVDIYTVSKQLTHSHVKTTEIYMHLVDHKRREAAESIVIK